MCARDHSISVGEMKAKEDDEDDQQQQQHVSEWEKGLPTNEELMPLTQSLISPALATAFSIKHEPPSPPPPPPGPPAAANNNNNSSNSKMSLVDDVVQRGARATLQNLRNQKPQAVVASSIPSFASYPSFQAHDNNNSNNNNSSSSRRGAHVYAAEGWVVVGDSRAVSGNGVVGSGDEAARGIGGGGGGGVNQRGPLCHPSGPYPPTAGGTGLVAPESSSYGGGGGGGSDETSFNPVDGRSDQGCMPYMMPCAVGAAAGGSTSYERQPENPYGANRGDDSSKGAGGGGEFLSSKNVRKRGGGGGGGGGGDSESDDGDDSAGCPENSSEEPNARTLKRPRLVWTPQLHKRFVDAVGHLGIKNAVPKTIMQLMNVEGLTRENVASHLQKYRLYLKRVQGLSSEGPSASDQVLFASTPLPPNLGGLHYVQHNNHRDDVCPGPPPPLFASPNVPMAPYAAVAQQPCAMGPGGHYGGYEHHHPYSGGVGRGGVPPPPPPQQSPQGDHREQQQIMGNENHHNHHHHGHNNNYNRTTTHNNQPSSPPQQRILTLFPTSSR